MDNIPLCWQPINSGIQEHDNSLFDIDTDIKFLENTADDSRELFWKHSFIVLVQVNDVRHRILCIIV